MVKVDLFCFFRSIRPLVRKHFHYLFSISDFPFLVPLNDQALNNEQLEAAVVGERFILLATK
jgi:hypothetical protein